MARKKIVDNPKSRNWKLLLYADNPLHLRALDLIENERPFNSDFQHSYILIQHKMINFQGEIITEGAGKLHTHVALHFENPVFQNSVAQALQLVDVESGLPDVQFVRPCTGKLDKFLVYLTHLSEPDKEQYSPSDLVGTPDMIAWYHRAALAYMSKEKDVREAVRACCEWVWSHDGRVNYSAFARWVLETPFFRARNDPLVIRCIDEHNCRIARIENGIQMQRIVDSQEEYQRRLLGASGSSSVLDLDSLALTADELEGFESFD